MLDPIIILIALLCGLLSRGLGFPALIGYLAAGFVLHELDIVGGELLERVSELGITLLLFSIGLKLQPKQLLSPQVWGTTLIHMAVMQGFFMALLWLSVQLLPGLTLEFSAQLVIAFALTFSSTVFVIQVMQERGESASRHANLAIGILIIQDLAAVIFLGFSAGKVPEPAAVLLLLLFPLRGFILRLLTHSGHGELFTLFGLVLTIVGAQMFESLGIKGDLGALMIGGILAGHQKSKELAKNLLYFKDLFLVAFFLSIGMGGWPDSSILLLAVVIGVLALIKPPLYFLLLTRFHAAPRTSLLASTALANFSEFGLIVVAVAVSSGWVDSQWSAALSITIAVSFLISSPLNLKAHVLYRRWHGFFLKHESQRIKDARPDTSGARVMILGMGNIGTGAYESIVEQYGPAVVGVDDNDVKLQRHLRAGRRVVAADASDPDFWHCVDLGTMELVMLALTNHEENKLVAKLLHDLGYQGKIAAVVRFAEEAEELAECGVSTFDVYAEAGSGFAAHAAEQL